jgi:hypothetical protein
MRRTERTRINGAEYETTVMPADIGLEVALEILNKIGPGLAGLIEAIGYSSAGIPSDLLISKAVEKVVTSLNPKETVSLFEKLFSFTTRNGRQVILSEDFAGNYKELLQAAAWVIKVNDFFGFLPDAVKNLRVSVEGILKPEGTQSQTPS